MNVISGWKVDRSSAREMVSAAVPDLSRNRAHIS